jgi:hypothetical protein
MRWKAKEKPKPQVGEIRIRRRFQWWPLCLNGLWRWLERVEVEQEYVETYHVESHVFGGPTVEPVYMWDDKEWIDV